VRDFLKQPWLGAVVVVPLLIISTLREYWRLSRRSQSTTQAQLIVRRSVLPLAALFLVIVVLRFAIIPQ
jgi:hypothetical protein